MATFEIETVLACSPENAFQFLIRPENIAKVSDPSIGLTLVRVPEVLGLGSRLEFQVDGFGPAQTSIHEIIDFVEPCRFVEHQVEGPFAAWRHEHLFQPHNESSVCVIDRIEFSPPNGLLGMLLTETRIQDALNKSFAVRQRELKRHLE